MESPETKIHVLPESVASHIAAGEIVERPASVVKELLDNSLDAGATVMTVEITDGGKQMIRVSDDGEGMSRADAPLACRRFATSKLRHHLDLAGIATYGFRGEALPSIASVSRFRMVTARHGAPAGTAVAIEGGAAASVEECGAPPGTRVAVGELFFNTPARRKFLKTTATESSHVAHVVQQAALANVPAHFRLTHNEHVVFDYPKAAALEDRLLQVYGVNVMDMMLPVHHETPGVRVRGMAVNPSHVRTGRTPQEIFVNRRAVKNATIAHAVYEAYGSFLPKGRHPVFSIMVDVDADEVDVNVHPSKREVKFRTPDLVHRAVRESIRLLLQKHVAVAESPSAVGEAADGGTAAPVAHGRDGGGGGADTNARARSAWSTPAAARAAPAGHGADVVRESTALYERAPAPSEAMPSTRHDAPSLYEAAPEVRILGQIHATYIVAQVGDALHVLDQHTIHERVLFEQLWRNWKGRHIQIQPLLIPEPVALSPAMAAKVDAILPDLAALGLELERLGPSALVIRAAPALVGQMDYGALLEEIVEDVSEWRSVDSLDTRVRPVLASMACQGAVQAGRPMEEPEMRRVVRDWLREGVPMTCPHGRRISMHFGSEELHRRFRRL